VSGFPIVLSNGPPPDGFQAIADAGVTMIRAGRAAGTKPGMVTLQSAWRGPIPA
jgi:hypothetical protein